MTEKLRIEKQQKTTKTESKREQAVMTHSRFGSCVAPVGLKAASDAVRRSATRFFGGGGNFRGCFGSCVDTDSTRVALSGGGR
jgi:hypothetical protein